MVESLSDQLRLLEKDYHAGRTSEVLYRLGMMPHFIASFAENESEKIDLCLSIKELCSVAGKHNLDLVEAYVIALENNGVVGSQELTLYSQYPDLFIKSAEFILGQHTSWRPDNELHQKITARSQHLTRKKLTDDFELRAYSH